MTVFLDLPKWTKEKIELLKTLLIAGNSASQIGIRLGVSKNSVIGTIHRLGLSSLRPPPPPRETRRRRATPSTAGATIKRALVSGKVFLGKWVSQKTDLQKREMTIEQPTTPPDSKFACTFEELTESKCKYPHGDPQTPEFRFCGMPRLSGKPYCGHCSRLAYMPMTSMNLFGVPKS